VRHHLAVAKRALERLATIVSHYSLHRMSAHEKTGTAASNGCDRFGRDVATAMLVVSDILPEIAGAKEFARKPRESS
jgi:hypothetical protein